MTIKSEDEVVIYPQYYPELRNDFNQYPSKHFACDTMAVTYYCQKYPTIQAIIKDDGDGNITCVQEFKEY